MVWVWFLWCLGFFFLSDVSNCFHHSFILTWLQANWLSLIIPHLCYSESKAILLETFNKYLILQNFMPRQAKDNGFCYYKNCTGCSESWWCLSDTWQWTEFLWVTRGFGYRCLICRTEERVVTDCWEECGAPSSLKLSLPRAPSLPVEKPSV